MRANFQGRSVESQFTARRRLCPFREEDAGFKGIGGPWDFAAGQSRGSGLRQSGSRQSTPHPTLALRFVPKRHSEPRCSDPDAEKRFGIRTRLCTTIGRVLGTHRRCPCAPCSNPGNTQGGRRAAQMARWLAARNPNKSQMFPVKEPNGSRIPPGRSSLPCGKACNASGSSNHVPERTSDQQR